MPAVAPRVLVRLLRRPAPRELPSAGMRWLETPGAVDRLVAIATPHGVQGSVLTGMLALRGSEAGDPVAASARAALAPIRMRAMLWNVEQDRALSALADAGLRPIALKGAALTRRVYTDVAERVMGDLDVLVDPGDAERAIAVLVENLGYRRSIDPGHRRALRRHHFHERVTHPRGFEVEIHWDLTRPGEAIHLDAPKLRGRARAGGHEAHPEIRLPTLEDTLLHTASQAEQGALRRLSRIVDVDRILAAADLDWTYVAREAERVGLAVPLALALQAAHRLLGTVLPERAHSALRPPAAPRWGLASLDPEGMLLRDRGAPASTALLLRAWCQPTWRARLGLIGRAIVGSEDPLQELWDRPDHAPGGIPAARTSPPLVAAKLAAVQAACAARYAFRIFRSYDDVFWSRKPGRDGAI